MFTTTNKQNRTATAAATTTTRAASASKQPMPAGRPGSRPKPTSRGWYCCQGSSFNTMSTTKCRASGCFHSMCSHCHVLSVEPGV